MSVSLFKKYIVSTIVIFLIAFVLEIFVFNFSSWRMAGFDAVTVAENADVSQGEDYYTETFDLNAVLWNVHADLEVAGDETASVSVILTDEGDKYEYITPEFTVCNGVPESGYCNVYPFGEARSVTIKVTAPEQGTVHINSITLNDRKPPDIKPLRLLAVFLIIWFGYLIWSDTFLHKVYFDISRKWQIAVTAAVLVVLIVVCGFINHADKVIMASPWPHHLQYQELARSLEHGSVVLSEQNVDPGLLEAENPYDTIALQAEGIAYSMDYAYYNGNYYAYFGIVPELLMYYPYHMLTGGNLSNYRATFMMFVLFIFGVFFCVAGIIRRYFRKVPFLFYLMICTATVLGANFIYLIGRSDIYNVPILSGTAFTFVGLGFWFLSLDTQKLWLKRTALALGSFSMALVAGCRPQLALISFISIILFMFPGKGQKRYLFSKETIRETACFILPYVIVAIPVCWYNAARFGSIFEFGAAYSLTTNDMNHRGFNFDRLLRSMYCYLFQPPVIKTDYPFLMTSVLEGNYMGKFLFEHTYGGILVANTFMASIWLMAVNGFRKIEAKVKAPVLFLIASGIFVAGFDANEAGVIYRYTCDFAPAFFLAAILLWLVLVSESGREILSYSFVAPLLYTCVVIALGYSFLTFIASGNSVCLENDNAALFYSIAEYFKF